LGEQKENRQQEVSTMSRMMKIFAKELSVPFWYCRKCRAERSSAVTNLCCPTFVNRVPIEQDADMVMFLHRPKKVDKPTSPESIFVTNYEGNLIKLLVLKNRNGKIGNVFFDWNGDKQTYIPIDYREGEAAAPPIKINTEITKLEGVGEKMSGSPFDDLKAVVAPTETSVTETVESDEIVEVNGNAELYADELVEETEIPF
jgi:Replicative DNA helicase